MPAIRSALRSSRSPSLRALALGIGGALLFQACATERPRPAAPAPVVAPPIVVPKAPRNGLVLLDEAALTAVAPTEPLASLPAPPVNPPADTAPPSAPVLPKAPAGPPDWHDDGTLASLQAAIAQSLAYYGTLPPNTPISVGPLTYTAMEMAQSLDLFLTLRLTASDPAEFSERLRRNFVVFESIAEQGDNLFTGYYEPHIPGSLTPTAQFAAPLYARPDDLVEVALNDFGKDLPRRRVMGRVQEGRLVPYYSREEIGQGGVLEGRAKPIVYVNEVDLFFLQIQGSGQVELPDGRTISVGYAATNGQPYRALGAEMIRRNLMAREEVSLFSLKRYLADHQDLTPGLLNSNPSYVFFHTRDDGRGPLGNLQVPLTSGRSLAADQLLLPPGVLAYVMTTVPVPERLGEEPGRPPQRLGEDPATQPERLREDPVEPSNPIGGFRDLDRFMLIQDTGGAIRGHGRGDLFWGEGPDAEWIAGRSRNPGRLFILVARKDALPPQEPPPQPVPRAPQPAVLGRPLQARMP